MKRGRRDLRLLHLNEAADESWKKSVDDVVETSIAARRESGITFVHFNKF